MGPQGGHGNLHCRDEETEAQPGAATCPESHRWTLESHELGSTGPESPAQSPSPSGAKRERRGENLGDTGLTAELWSPAPACFSSPCMVPMLPAGRSGCCVLSQALPLLAMQEKPSQAPLAHQGRDLKLPVTLGKRLYLSGFRFLLCQVGILIMS